MTHVIDGPALVYCEGAFNTTNGKTAHGLVRFTERYNVAAVIDSRYTGHDAGEILDGKKNGIPVFASVDAAFEDAANRDLKPLYLRDRPGSRRRPPGAGRQERHHPGH